MLNLKLQAPKENYILKKIKNINKTYIFLVKTYDLQKKEDLIMHSKS